MEDGDGPKIKQAKTRNIFVCLFFSLLFFTWPQTDNLYVVFQSLSLLVFQGGLPVVYKRENPGEEFSTRVTRESHASG